MESKHRLGYIPSDLHWSQYFIGYCRTAAANITRVSILIDLFRQSSFYEHSSVITPIY